MSTHEIEFDYDFGRGRGETIPVKATISFGIGMVFVENVEAFGSDGGELSYHAMRCIEEEALERFMKNRATV